jgi:hypothetical protein
MTGPRGFLLAVLFLTAVACGEAAPATGPAAGPPSTPVTTAPPQRDEAQQYRTMATVLEAGDRGPRLCHALAESYPPQCDGPAIIGWDWDAVDGEETASGVTWVDAALVGTWDGEHFTVTRPVEAVSAWPEPPHEDTTPPAPAGDRPTAEELYALQEEVDDVVAGGDTPLGPQLGSFSDVDRGVVAVQVIAATPQARAFARQRWGERVVLEPMLRPID